MNHSGWRGKGSPYHRTEQEIQRRYGMRDRIEHLGQMAIRPDLDGDMAEFLIEQEVLWLGTLDADKRPAASIVIGRRGFVRPLAANRVRLEPTPSSLAALERMPAVGEDVAVLALDLTYASRMRLNGTIAAVDSSGFEIATTQAYPNCPKYIHRRALEIAPDHAGAAATGAHGDALGAGEVSLIERADTFFIASRKGSAREDASYGMDVSHRGGNPGFVRFANERTLLVPDFIGNFLFNTVGNLIDEPPAGLLFLDFDTGEQVRLSVDSEIIFDGPEIARYAGARRMFRFSIKRWSRAPALPLRGRLLDVSPFVGGQGWRD